MRLSRSILLGVFVYGFTSVAQCQEFEVVSVKPNNSGSGSSHIRSNQGMVMGINLSLRSLILMAYRVKDYQVEGPDWLASQNFDVTAKLPEALSRDPEKYSAALGAMTQKMLIERFHLAVHFDQKALPVYGLVVAKNGIKFMKVPDRDSHTSDSNNTHFKGSCVTMSSFAEFVSRRRTELPNDLPVLDMTGLEGCYDITLDWVPEPRQSSEAKAEAPSIVDSKSGPAFPVALQEQLGLKLETRKAPIQFLIVEHADKLPTEN